MLFVWFLIIEILLRLLLPVPFFNTKEVLQAFYPAYKEVKTRKIVKDDETFDILILGGSVVAAYYPIEKLLQEQLQLKTSKPIRIHNVAEPAHTSLDSYYKYKKLLDKSFDLVLFYHGINETRANNCPDSIFKKDYTHYSWYRALRQIDRQKEIRWTILPYTLHYAWIYLQEFIGSPELIHFKDNRKDWMKYGNSIKTEAAFRENIEKILSIAKRKNEKVILMSFAYYIPDDYSKEKFVNKALDYTRHNRAIEIWGKPEYVEKGILVHNTVIKSLAELHKEVIFFRSGSFN